MNTRPTMGGRGLTVLLFLLLAGCVTTQGVRNSQLKSDKPFIFHFNGTQAEARPILKRMLIEKGFRFEEDDAEAGLMVASKLLAPDERVQTTVFTEVMTGISSGAQTGSLTFMFTETDSLLVVSMQPRLTLTLNESQNAFKNRQHTESATLTQGHPMSIKYALLLNGNGFDLISPRMGDLLPSQSTGPEKPRQPDPASKL